MSRRIPLEGRSKPHWDTGAICNSGHENIYGNKSTNIRIKAYFLRLFNSEYRKCRAQEIHIRKEIWLHGKVRQDIVFTVIHRAVLRVVLVVIATKSIDKHKEPEESQNQKHRAE